MNTRRVAIYICAALIAVWSLVPIYYLFNISLMWPVEIFTYPTHLFPQNPTLSNYLSSLGIPVYDPYTGQIIAVGHAPYIRAGIFNSAVVALLVMVITIVLATPAGYVLGRLTFPRKNTLLFILVGSRSLPPVSILVPFYFFFYTTGLIGTITGLVIAYLSITIPIITWVLMGFFATLPKEVEWAARIDGMGRTQAFIRVVVPMAAPGIATSAILAFLMSWNEFMFAWVLASGTPAQTLPAAIGSMFAQWGQINIMAASVMIGIVIPIAIAVIFQRYITQLRIVDPVTTMAVS
jgi:multiple sugar transport system permease protein